MRGPTEIVNRYTLKILSGIPWTVVLTVLAVCVAGAFMCATDATAQEGGRTSLSQEEACRQKYQEGMELQNSRRLDQAAEAFDEVRETCPDMIDSYIKLGLILVQLNDYMEAIDVYEDALDRDPENMDLKEAMAYALSSAGELEDAIDIYLELIRSAPDNTDLLKNLAFVYRQSGMIPEAITLYNRLIELGVADPQMVSEAGRIALQNKLYLAAVAFYQKLYESDPSNVSTLHILGGYYWKIKFYDQVIPYYGKILEMEPDHAQALTYHKILGECARKIKDYDQAAIHSEYVLEQEPGNVNNYINLPRIYKDDGKYQEAIDVIKRGLERFPDNGALYYWWGASLDVKGQAMDRRKSFIESIDAYNEAKEKFQKVIDLQDPTYSPHATKQLGRMDEMIERTRMMQDREDN
jgi:tetratricopeptide (TPR) repeat protein